MFVEQLEKKGETMPKNVSHEILYEKHIPRH